MSRHFSNWLEAYMRYTSTSESPDAFHFWTGVSTIGGALKGRVWIDEYIFKWKPNFYILLIGPPGVAAKSTTINLGMRLLRKTPKFFEGPTSCTWQALGKSFLDAAVKFTYRDEEGELIEQHMSAITISASEVGTFLRPEDPRLIDVLTDLWDSSAETWNHTTVNSSEFTLAHPWLNFLGATTPSWLRQNVPEVMIGGGFASRVIFVYRESKRQLNAYPSQGIASSEYATLQEKLIEDLTQISTLSGPYILTPDAREWGTEWYKKHWTNGRRSEMASDRYGGYWSRKQAHIHKLAIVLAAARGNDLSINSDILIEANTLAETIENDMIKVFNTIGGVQEAHHINEMVQYVRTYQEMTSAELWQKCYNTMTGQTFQSALDGAVRGEFLKIVRHGTDVKVALGKNANNL